VDPGAGGYGEDVCKPGVPGERLGPAARQERVQDPRPQPERVARATGPATAGARA